MSNKIFSKIDEPYNLCPIMACRCLSISFRDNGLCSCNRGNCNSGLTGHSHHYNTFNDKSSIIHMNLAITLQLYIIAAIDGSFEPFMTVVACAILINLFVYRYMGLFLYIYMGFLVRTDKLS